MMEINKFGKTGRSKNAMWVSAGVVAAVVSLASGPSAARAAMLSWDPGATPATPSGGTGNWDLNTTTAWSDGAADTTWTDSTGANDTAAFAGTAGTVTVTTNVGAAGLLFSTAGYTLTGNSTLTIGASGLDGSALTSGVTTVSAPLSLAAAQSWALGSGSTISVSGAISGSGAMTKIGNGNITLTGANTFSGGITLNAGTLAIGGTGTGTSNAPTTGALGTGTVTLSGGTLSAASGTSVYNSIAVPTGSSVGLSSASAGLTIAGSITGGGTINESGSNTGGTHLSGDNSGFTGTFISNGNGGHRVRFDNPNAGSASAAWTLNNTNVDGTGFAFTAASTISFGSLAGGGYLRNDSVNNAAVTLSIGALNTDSSFTGLVASNNNGRDIAITKVGTGTFSFGNNNSTFGGNTTISGGTFLLTAANGISHSATILIAGGTLSSNIPATTSTANVNNISLSDGALSPDGTGVGSFTLAANKTFTMSGGTLAETIASLTSFDQLLANATTPGTFSITGGSLDLSSSTGIDYTQLYPILSGFSSGSVSALDITGYDTNDYLASLSNTGVLTFTPVAATPEPASLAVLGASMLGLVLRRRRPSGPQ